MSACVHVCLVATEVRTPDLPLQLELQRINSHYVGAGDKIWVLRPASVLSTEQFSGMV